MIYCVTLIIIVALICVTRLYPLWVEHDRKQLAKAMELLRKAKEENANLRKSSKEIIDEWLRNLNETSDSFNKTWDKLYEVCDKLNIKL
ncbi:MAG: hypothetical protein HDS87_06950 [Bacteroidales bacterium]|nr:hypothetical protein [Bacteroidales bacterium]